ncbi:RNaseH domain-containing protein [Tolypothrix sp. VBCCA 56010]|uniref:RNaseH domain-containing protein n=1 Tax=Tolypothrix sp. VBCCA 56010 TaxID=3137731 RepID=UPI003D7C9617
MSNNFSDDFEFNDDLSELDEESLMLDEDEIAEITSFSDTFYIPLSRVPKLLKRYPLAFTVPDNLSPVIVEGFTLAWTKKSLATFAEILKVSPSDGRSNVKNLPYASLRGLLEVGLNNAARIRSNLGLNKYALNPKNPNEPEPFAYINGGIEEEIRTAIRSILNDWVTNFLKPFADKEKVSLEVCERLEELLEEEELVTIYPFKSYTLPWDWSKETDTTQAKDKHAYPMLADFVARQIAGHEIFQRLGSMKRIISSSGMFTNGVAELITNPIEGKYSLVVRIEVVTYPSLHQPLLKIDVSKRRWLSQLKSPSFDRYDISGFIFSKNHPDRAFSFKIICQQDKNKNWHWVTDKDFEALRRELKLSMQPFDGQQIASGKASTDQCQVVLTYRDGLQDNSDSYEDDSEEDGIEKGVPEIDKLEAFEAITKILKPLKIKPFDSYKPVKSSHKLDDTASRMINLPTLLGAVLEVLETNPDPNPDSKFTPKYLEQLDDIQLNSSLNKHFDISLEAIDRKRNALKFSKPKSPDQTQELQAIIQANSSAMRRLYPNERLSLIVFYEDGLETEVKLLKAIIPLLWGETLEVLFNRLPANTAGPRELLPGEKLKAKERSRHRVEAWEPIAQQIKNRRQQTFCLILAPKFYPDPSGQKTARRDDKVNKPSTRQALAAKAGACVQFLEPMAKTLTTKRFKLEDFFRRVQTALKDLLSAHSGRIDGVQEKVDKYLENIPPEARPKEILSITIVRKQRGRVRGPIKDTFLAVAMRLKVDTGKCELCCAYEKANRLEISPWKDFSHAISFIADLSPIKLASEPRERKTRFMEFVKQIVSNSVEEGAQPLVIIDSSNCVQMWPWLADIRMDANQIDLGQQYQWMQQEWQGARLIRVRQDLAPGIIEKKARQLAETSLEDTRSIEELKKLPPSREIPSASSSTGLFRLTAKQTKTKTNQTGCVAYLSVGKRMPQQYSRGQSCYLPTKINTHAEKGDGSKDKLYNNARLAVHQIATRKAFLGHWPTPNPLEIVVTLRQPEDNPDSLAMLLESLRYSFGHYRDWTTLPAPLFFERVVRDYISEFALEDEDTEGETDS